MSKPKILAVDDVSANLVALERALERLDVEVVRASSGDEALRCLVKHDFALILMDVMMPGLSGVETAELIRQDPPYANIPIIFITAQDPTDELTFQGYAVGAVDHLYKPLRSDVLLSKVRVFLRLYNQRALIEAARADFENFAHMASHDLRAPLRQMRGLTEMVLANHGEALGPDGRELQQRVVDTAARAERLVSGLLAFASSGQVHQSSGAVDLVQVFEEVVLDLAEQIEESGARVTFGDLPTIRGGRGLLYQVFQNIVANAIKYRRPGVPPEVEVSAHQTTAETAIAVQDNGLGFAQDQVERIFQPFTRLDGPHATRGSGIGLATVKRIVDRHRGTVEAFGEPGAGARIVVRLPRALKRTATQGKCDKVGEVPSESPLTTLLIVDDDPMELLLAESYPGKHFALLTAEGALAALEVLESQHVDAIVSDYNMPGRDGIWLLEQVRDRHPGVRRFLSSSHLLTAIRGNTRVIEAYFEKPAKPSDIAERLLGLAMPATGSG